jgi:hypothetical protein
MIYSSFAEVENITPAEARLFLRKLAALRLYFGDIYVQPMAAAPMEGGLPLLAEVPVGEQQLANLQLKVFNVAAQSDRYINIAVLKRHFGAGNINELGSVAESMFKTKQQAIENIPGYEEAVKALIQNA